MSTGIKFDGNKPRWGLLPHGPLKMVVWVLTLGSIKYAPNNWLKVDDAYNRYYDAMQRHATGFWEAYTEHRDDSEISPFDKEYGTHHLANMICCALFLLHFEFKRLGAIRFWHFLSDIPALVVKLKKIKEDNTK